MRLVLTVLFLLLALSATALAHESHKGFKYESYCCNGDAETGDCQMIPTRSVRVTPDGYEVSLAPGDHRMVTRRHVFSWSQREARRSTVGRRNFGYLQSQGPPPNARDFRSCRTVPNHPENLQ